MSGGTWQQEEKRHAPIQCCLLRRRRPRPRGHHHHLASALALQRAAPTSKAAPCGAGCFTTQRNATHAIPTPTPAGRRGSAQKIVARRCRNLGSRAARAQDDSMRDHGVQVQQLASYYYLPWKAAERRRNKHERNQGGALACVSCPLISITEALFNSIQSNSTREEERCVCVRAAQSCMCTEKKKRLVGGLRAGELHD